MILLSAVVACADRTELTDTHNYAFSSEIEAVSFPVATRTDLEVEWGGLEVDLLGRTLDPAQDLSELSIGILALSQEEALDTLTNGILLQSDVVAAANLHLSPGQTSARLSDFAFLATQVVPEENVLPDLGSWLLSAYSEGEAGARMLTFFEPQDDGPVVPITLHSDSATLTYTVDLDAGEPVALAGTLVDWSALTLDMRGQPLRLPDIDGLTLARFEEPIETLEAQFLDLDTLAEQRFETRFSGVVSLDLATLLDEEGAPFGGLDGEGVWLLALQCSLCANPAPPFLAQVR